MEKRYQIIYTSELQPGTTLSDVAEVLSSTFKISPEKVRLFLSMENKKKVLKNNLSYDIAKQYKDKLIRAGILVKISEIPQIQSQHLKPEYANSSIEAMNNNKDNRADRHKIDSHTGSKKRPASVWLISCFFGFPTGFKLIAAALVLIGAFQLNDAHSLKFESFSNFDYLVSFSPTVCKFIGAILLFFLSRYAFHLFFLSLLIEISQIIYRTIFNNYLELINVQEAVYTIGYFAIIISVLVYTKLLINKDILK